MTTTQKDYSDYPYPRNFVRRQICKFIGFVIRLVCLVRVRVEGLENIPKDEPVLLVANHFSFADPLILGGFLPWQLEFLAGTDRPAAPNKFINSIPDWWGVYKVKRASSARAAFQAAEAVLGQNGLLLMFPEGGAWANVLVPPRPGAALIATTNQCRMVPIAVETEGLFDLYKKGRRGELTMVVGKPFGPFEVTGRGRERRKQLDAAGEEMMRKIADLLPPEKRGVYSDDEQIRAEAEKVAAYPW